MEVKGGGERDGGHTGLLRREEENESGPSVQESESFVFLLSVLWMDKNQLAFATGRRLLKLLTQRNAFLKIFCCFIFLTPCCNKQTIIDHGIELDWLHHY